jgi:osmotically-inducible protein OsmY
MKNLLWLTPIVLSSSLILPACNEAPDNRAPATQSSTSSKMSDSDLEKAIRTKLDSDQETKQANLSVSADVNDNKATISGTVASQNVRTKAIELARAAQPGLTVNDEIEVKPAG